ncbi:MAG: zinc-binding dehydrogenase, partial [Chloroflexota bacterium]
VAKVVPGPGAELIELPTRAPGPGEVRLRIEVAAICGSDVHVYDWAPRVARSGMNLPLVMGHEYSAEVIAVGEGVTNLKPGDRVAGETHLPCGDCYVCRIGKPHICQNLKIVGRHLDGCFAEEMVVPALCTYKIPAGLSAETAAVLEPLGCGVRPLLDAEVAGGNVVILGAGPIGLFAMAGARAMGAAEVVATNRSEFRLELAREMGAGVCLNPTRDDVVARVRDLTGGVGADIVLESSGNPEALRQGLRMLRKGGTMLLIGLPSTPVEIDFTNEVILKEATVKGFHGREMYRTWERVMPMVVRGAIPTAPVITHRLPLDGFAEGFAAAAERRAGKVLLTP